MDVLRRSYPRYVWRCIRRPAFSFIYEVGDNLVVTLTWLLGVFAAMQASRDRRAVLVALDGNTLHVHAGRRGVPVPERVLRVGDG